MVISGSTKLMKIMHDETVLGPWRFGDRISGQVG